MTSSGIKHRGRLLLVATALALSATTGVVLATDSGAAAPARHWTPNSCIRANGGDWNACNVGNSGSGDLPYRPAPDIVPAR